MFTDTERKIFSYELHKDRPRVWCDPMEITEKLEAALGGKADDVLQDFFSADRTKQLQVFEQVKQAVLYAFGLEPFDPNTGAGTLFETWYGALNEYLDFFQRFEPSTDTGPTSAPPSEPQPSSPAA